MSTQSNKAARRTNKTARGTVKKAAKPALKRARASNKKSPDSARRGTASVRTLRPAALASQSAATKPVPSPRTTAKAATKNKIKNRSKTAVKVDKSVDKSASKAAGKSSTSAAIKTVAIKSDSRPEIQKTAKPVSKVVSRIAAQIAAKVAAAKGQSDKTPDRDRSTAQPSNDAPKMIRTASPPMQPIAMPEAPIVRHKYQVGESVYFTSPNFGRAAASGNYIVVKLLPSESDDYQYRIKSAGEAFERVAKESQLDKI